MAEAAKKAPEPEVKPGGTAEEVKDKPKKDWMGLVVFSLVLLNVLVVIGMGYFVEKMWTKIRVLQAEAERAKLPEPSPIEEEHKNIGRELEPPVQGVLYPMESFLVNINSETGPKFLQTQMEFELSDPGVEEEVTRKKAAIRDAIIVMLSSRSYKDLREQSGMKRLRNDLLKAINQLLSTGKIREIYFTQFHFN